MEFKIKISNDEKKSICKMPFRTCGTEDLKKVRESFSSIRRIPAENVRGYVPERTSFTIEIEISEKTAQEIAHFNHKNEIEVKVPENYLQNLMIEVPVRYDDEKDNDEPLDFGIIWALKEDAFLEKWGSLGYPLEIKEAQ